MRFAHLARFDAALGVNRDTAGSAGSQRVTADRCEYSLSASIEQNIAGEHTHRACTAARVGVGADGTATAHSQSPVHSDRDAASLGGCAASRRKAADAGK